MSRTCSTTRLITLGERGGAGVGFGAVFGAALAAGLGAALAAGLGATLGAGFGATLGAGFGATMGAGFGATMGAAGLRGALFFTTRFFGALFLAGAFFFATFLALLLLPRLADARFGARRERLADFFAGDFERLDDFFDFLDFFLAAIRFLLFQNSEIEPRWQSGCPAAE